MVSMVVPARSRLGVLQETPGEPLQPRDQGISSLRSGGIQAWLLSPEKVGERLRRI